MANFERVDDASFVKAFLKENSKAVYGACFARVNDVVRAKECTRRVMGELLLAQDAEPVTAELIDRLADVACDDDAYARLQLARLPKRAGDEEGEASRLSPYAHTSDEARRMLTPAEWTHGDETVFFGEREEAEKPVPRPSVAPRRYEAEMIGGVEGKEPVYRQSAIVRPRTTPVDQMTIDEIIDEVIYSTGSRELYGRAPGENERIYESAAGKPVYGIKTDRDREAKETAAREKAAREREAREAAAREREMREREAKEAAAREREMREREAKEAAAREREMREREAREAAARKKEALDREAKEAAAREKATREHEAKEAAAREKAAREHEAKEAAAREKATREHEAKEAKRREKAELEREAKEAKRREKPVYGQPVREEPEPEPAPKKPAAQKKTDDIFAPKRRKKQIDLFADDGEEELIDLPEDEDDDAEYASIDDFDPDDDGVGPELLDDESIRTADGKARGGRRKKGASPLMVLLIFALALVVIVLVFILVSKLTVMSNAGLAQSGFMQWFNENLFRFF